MHVCHTEVLARQRRALPSRQHALCLCAGVVTMGVPCSASTQQTSPLSLLARAEPTAASAGSGGHKRVGTTTALCCVPTLG